MGILIAILTLVVSAISWWWFIGRNTPKYPPLNIEDDDPLLIEAIKKARNSLDKFQELYKEGRVNDVQVKVLFTSNDSTVEHLWAEVLELRDSIIKVRYITPPVNHDGKLERIHEYPISEIEDWAIFCENGNIYGGYSQRVMFIRARERWGSLPPELKRQESRYVG